MREKCFNCHRPLPPLSAHEKKLALAQGKKEWGEWEDKAMVRICEECYQAIILQKKARQAILN